MFTTAVKTTIVEALVALATKVAATTDALAVVVLVAKAAFV